MIRILICDDQAIVRDGLEMMLGLEKDMEIVALAEDGAEAVELAAEHTPDLVLMDLNMPIMNGIEATRRIKQGQPNLPILALTTYNADDWVFDALRAGASGYLLKDTPREDLLAAVRGTVSGRSFIDPDIAGKLVKHVANTSPAAPSASSKILDRLTDREADVLRLIAQGVSNQDIAKTLFLSEGTVRNYVSQVFAKLEVTDRTQAAVIALKHGIG